VVQKKIASFLFLDGATRIAVARALGGGPLDPEVQQALLGLLEDENSQVRQAAVTSLARRTADPAVQRGIAPLLKDPHLRAAAAKVLSGHPLDPAP
jgi:HEAT repeat protein